MPKHTMKVPGPIFHRAQVLQRQLYAEKGIRRDMWEIIPLVYDEMKVPRPPRGEGGFRL